MLVGTTRSHVHDGTLLRPAHMSTDTPKSTTKEQRGVTTHHTTNTKVTQLRPTLGSSGEASSSRVPRRVPRPARRGTNNAAKRSQPMMMLASTSKRWLWCGACHRGHGQKQAPGMTTHEPIQEAPAQTTPTPCGLMKSFMTMGPYPKGWKSMRPPSRATLHPFPERT
jgi:hypothetical protein